MPLVGEMAPWRDVIEAGIGSGAFEGGDVEGSSTTQMVTGRGFGSAQMWQVGSSVMSGAGLAEFDALLDARYGFGEFGGFSFGHADEVIGETLCGFGSDAWESAEGFDDACDGCGDAAGSIVRGATGDTDAEGSGREGGHW